MRHIQAGILVQASNASSSLPGRTSHDIFGEHSLTQQRHCAGITPLSCTPPEEAHLYTTPYRFPNSPNRRGSLGCQRQFVLITEACVPVSRESPYTSGIIDIRSAFYFIRDLWQNKKYG